MDYIDLEMERINDIIQSNVGRLDASEYANKVPEYGLDCLTEGSTFPPVNQLSRIKMYDRNKLLLQGNFDKGLPLIKRRIIEMLQYSIKAGSDTYIYAPSSENDYKIITDSIIEIANGCGGLKLSSYDTNKLADKLIENISEYLESNNITNKIIEDVVAYGESVILLYKDEEQAYGLRVVNPKYWIPVVNPNNDKVIYHIIYKVVKVNNQDILIVQVHEKGRYYKITYTYSNRTLGKCVDSEIVETGLNDFAVKVINTRGEIFGYDMYTPINNHVIQNIVDMTLHDYTSNRNTVPMMQGPESCLDVAPEYDTNVNVDGVYVKRRAGGEKQFSYKSYYPLGESLDGKGTTQKIEQVKIELDNEAYLIKIDRRRQLIGKLTGMIGTMRSFDKEGNVQSGTAKRLEYASDINKTKDIVKAVNSAIKSSVNDCLVMLGLSDIKVTSDWKVDILLDEKELAELEKIRLESGVTSITSSMIRQFGYSDNEVAKELKLIEEEKSSLKK